MAKHKHRLAINLRKLRYINQYSQRGMICFLHLHGVEIEHKRYAAYEEDRNAPPLDLVKAIAGVFSLTMDELCYSKLDSEDFRLRKV